MNVGRKKQCKQAGGSCKNSPDCCQKPAMNCIGGECSPCGDCPHQYCNSPADWIAWPKDCRVSPSPVDCCDCGSRALGLGQCAPGCYDNPGGECVPIPGNGPNPPRPSPPNPPRPSPPRPSPPSPFRPIPPNQNPFGNLPPNLNLCIKPNPIISPKDIPSNTLFKNCANCGSLDPAFENMVKDTFKGAPGVAYIDYIGQCGGKNGGKNGGLNGGEIAGIVIGSLLGLGLIILIVYMLMKKKTRKSA